MIKKFQLYIVRTFTCILTTIIYIYIYIYIYTYIYTYIYIVTGAGDKIIYIQIYTHIDMYAKQWTVKCYL